MEIAIMKPKFITAFMDVAHRFSQLSSAIRLQVGAIIVKDDRIISIGYNGMPAGWDNDCEYREYCLSRDFNGNYFPGTEAEYPFEDERGRYKLKTRPEVLHAERNAIDKLARTTESGLGATMFITHAPCMECSKSIYGAGIQQVYYRHQYRNTDGLEFLARCQVSVTQVKD
jgi:dCMP deaminase